MNLSSIEEYVRLASCDGPHKAAAIQELHNLRTAKECSTIGLKLFLESQNDAVKFFGLSLIRDYLSSPPSMNNQDSEQRKFLRETVYQWIEHGLRTDMQNIPPYVLNSMITIIALIIKRDYPEVWPTAFHDFLKFGQVYGFNGVDVLIRILNELEIEVVMFNEVRTKEEIAHNTLIKDTMRGTNTISDIIQYLSTTGQSLISTVYAPTPNPSLNKLIELTSRCLLCLSEMVGWVDIQLVLNFAFPTIVSAVTSTHGVAGGNGPTSPLRSATSSTSYIPAVRKGGLTCVFEMVKKGMDPWLKIPILNNLQLLPILQSVTPKYAIPPANNIELDDEEVEVEKQLGYVMDMVLLEAIGCYAKLEELVLCNGTVPNAPPVSMEECEQMHRIVVPLLHTSMQLYLSLLVHPQVSVALTLTPSLTRYVHFLKSQKSSTAKRDGAFIAQEYVSILLLSILTQARYPKDFPFALCNEEQEDLWEIAEGKKEFTRYFSNFCRIYPSLGEQLLVQQLQSLSPLSQGNVYELEGCLRLLYAYAETAVNTTELNESHAFIGLLVALHDASILQHPHEQVALAYYELMMKYGKYCPLPIFHNTFQALLQFIHAQHQWSANPYHHEIRGKCVNMAYRLMEAAQGTVGYTLLPFVEQKIPEILSTNTQQLWSQHQNAHIASTTPTATGNKKASKSRKINLLSDYSISQLYEIINFAVTSFIPPSNPELTTIRNRQFTLFQQTLSFVSQYFHYLLSQGNGNTSSALPADVLEEYLGNELSHIAILLKHLPTSNNGMYRQEISNITGILSSLSSQWLASSSLLRQRIILLCHQLLLLEAGICGDVFSMVLSYALTVASLEEIEGIVAFCNQVINYTASAAIPSATTVTTTAIDGSAETSPAKPPVDTTDFPKLWNTLQGTFPALLQRNLQLLHDFEANTTGSSTVSITTACSPGGTAKGNTTATGDLPSFEAERVAYLKPWLSFLVHMAIPPLHTMFLAFDMATFDQLLDMILLIAKGYTAFGKAISKSQSIPLKRLVYAFVTQLAHHWDTFRLTHSAMQTLSSPFYPVVSVNHPNVQRFQRFVEEQWIPVQLMSLGHPLSESQIGSYLVSMVADYQHVKVSMKDAATQSLLVEIATMLYVKAHPFAASVPGAITGSVSPQGMDPSTTSNFAFGQYLNSLLSMQLRWPEANTQALLAQLYPQTVLPLGTYRDQFKTFIRKQLN